MNKHILSFIVLSLTIFLHSDEIIIKSIYDLLPLHPEIQYIKCNGIQSFDYQRFPISRFPELQPHKGLLAETFILKIPNGQVFSFKGWIKIDNAIIDECIGRYASQNNHLIHIQNATFQNIQKISGRVAVITSECDQYYGHWLYNILGRLALLQMHNIEYDWLYVAYDKPFMQETLALWGIDSSKIITPFGDTKYIQADELIIPSLIGNRIPDVHQYPLTIIPLDQFCENWHMDPKEIDVIDYIPTPNIPSHIPTENYFTYWSPLCAFYSDPYIIKQIRNTFFSKADLADTTLAKRVFISRKDTPHRTMLNEDDVFGIFEQYGFKRYLLSNLSMLEKVTLFHNAEYIVGATGSGLMNILFCQPNATVVEIFQTYSDCASYYLAQTLGLHYHCIQTIPFTNIGWGENTHIPLDMVQNFVNTHLHTQEAL